MRQEDYHEFITRPGFIAETVPLKTKMLGGGVEKEKRAFNCIHFCDSETGSKHLGLCEPV